jgi:hypothetical protein
MEFRKYKLVDGAYELVGVTEKMPTKTEGFQIESYDKEKGVSVVIIPLTNTTDETTEILNV